MAKTTITFDDVKRIALRMPEVEESTIYRSPALKFRGSLLTCVAIHKSAEPHSLVIEVGFDKRAELIALDPGTYYLTDHYVNYPVVLARMSRLDLDTLRNLLGMSYLFVKESAPLRKRLARKPRSRRAHTRG
jgi:hypothetical protein